MTSLIGGYFVKLNKNRALFALNILIHITTGRKTKNSDRLKTIVDSLGITNYTYVRKETETHLLLPRDIHRIIFDYFKNKKRKSLPDTVIFKTTNAKNNKSYWLALDSISYSKPAEIKAIFDKAERQFTLTTQNTKQVRLFLSAFKFSKNQTIRVRCNDSLVYEGDAQDTLFIQCPVDNLNLFKKENIELSICSFLAEPYTLVTFNKQEQLAQTLEQVFSKSVYLKVPQVHEDNFQTIPTSRNLILTNVPYNNPIVQQIVASLPFTKIGKKLMFNESIQIYKNDCLAFVHPWGSRKILFIYGNEPLKLMDSNNLVTDCGCDYILRRKNNPMPITGKIPVHK